MDLATKLVRYLEIRRKSQSEVARETGIAQGTISALTRGVQKATLNQAFLLGRALDVPVDFLADEAQSELPKQLGEAETAALDLIRALGLSKEEVLRRLANPPYGPMPMVSETVRGKDVRP